MREICKSRNFNYHKSRVGESPTHSSPVGLLNVSAQCLRASRYFIHKFLSKTFPQKFNHPTAHQLTLYLRKVPCVKKNQI